MEQALTALPAQLETITHGRPTMTTTTTRPFHLYRTAFHGGGLLSRHYSVEAAEKARRRAQSDCTCGCAVVVAAQDVEALPSADRASSPYAAATR